MRNRSASEAATREADTHVIRDFIHIVARDRATGDPYPYGFWSDIDDAVIDVVDGDTGTVVSRSFEAAGGLVQVGEINQQAGVVVQSASVTLSQLNDSANEILRNYDLRFAPIQILRGYMDPQTMRFIDPPVPEFVGFIDDAPLTTPEIGGQGSMTLNCQSRMMDMKRSSSAKRSDASQRLRNANDAFYKDVAVVSDWKNFWGQKSE